MELSVEGPTGRHLAYAYTGGKPFDAGQPCILFIHGALHDHSVWTLLARWFAHHGRSVLAVDLAGHARSAGRPLPDVESTADWVLALLDAAGVANASLVGHSMGSLIALEAASRAPSRVDRLVMIGTAYPMTVSAALLTTARDDPMQAIDQVNALSHSGPAAKPGFPGPGNWLQGANRALMRRVQSAQTGCNLFEHDFEVCDAYGNGMQAAANVRCPTHFVLGGRDRMTPARGARNLAEACRASVLSIDGGHALMAEAPDAVLDALRKIL